MGLSKKLRFEVFKFRETMEGWQEGHYNGER
jgi:hypothetical protein